MTVICFGAIYIKFAVTLSNVLIYKEVGKMRLIKLLTDLTDTDLVLADTQIGFPCDSTCYDYIAAVVMISV